MEKVKFENLEQAASRYALTTNSLNEILSDLENELKLNSQLIIDANKEDVKINKKQIKIKKLIDILNSYRNTECVLADDERKIIVYKGDPYLTLHICLQALTTRNKVLLLHDEFMLGVNEILLEIINKTFQKYNIVNLIAEINNRYNSKSIEQFSEIFDDVIVIGDSTMYQILELNEKAKFFSYNNIGIYCDSKNLEKLQEAIYLYSTENNFEIEVIYEENIEDVINEFNNDGFKNIAILLTNNTKNEKYFKENIINKQVYINENPFKEEVGNISKYFE